MNTLWTGEPIPEDVANRVHATRHLAAMSSERRAFLEREWTDAEASVPSCAEPISDALRERARLEWEKKS